MYGMTELKNLAAANIQQQLTENPDIAMNELLSSFTARFPAVMVSQADLVPRPRRRLDCLEDLQDWADMIVASGDQPHAGAALAELLRKLTNA
ncbi:hypothetical protein BN946_scf184976.g25 [Trametes cinnabarina]|uniref:Uncharacterized protein n=1 Tax=Pycnoporus cinnabarinus TaxID=5643 RepID=A0A060S585_PYCCI|nr:hypothetical protein BN946_scf184976.g25 [Trametes cinnabarina]